MRQRNSLPLMRWRTFPPLKEERSEAQPPKPGPFTTPPLFIHWGLIGNLLMVAPEKTMLCLEMRICHLKQWTTESKKRLTMEQHSSHNRKVALICPIRTELLHWVARTEQLIATEETVPIQKKWVPNITPPSPYLSNMWPVSTPNLKYSQYWSTRRTK